MSTVNLTALNATQLTTGAVPAARMPALTGDCTTSAGAVATTCTKINGIDQTTAWTTYTPTVTCGSGTITTLGTVTGRYKQIGKTVFVEADVAITTVGTCASVLRATLPLTAAAANFVGIVMEFNNTNKSGAALITSGGTLLNALDATGATFAASGSRIGMTAIYEVP
jgi:hypothetical protein